LYNYKGTIQLNGYKGRNVTDRPNGGWKLEREEEKEGKYPFF
jgi:hypothetical protein